jgi:glycosyltransferase involved in cell wall biosynthesis
VEAAEEEAQEGQPDIAHVFHQNNYFEYPRRLRRVCRAKYVLDIRSPLLVESPLRYWYRFRNGRVARQYDCVVTHGLESAWTQIGKNSKIVETGIGVDLGLIPCRIREADAQKPVGVVYIGSVSERRGSMTMIEAVLAAGRRVDIRLDVYGTVAEAFAAEVARKDSGGRVRFCGLIAREEVLQRLSEYEIGVSFVPKSLYDPAPPLKTLEYLANGLPTIATKTRGNAYFIEHEKNGLLAGDDVESFGAAIVRLAGDGALRHALSLKSRPSVEALDWKHVVQDRLLPVYRQVLGASPDNPLSAGL